MGDRRARRERSTAAGAVAAPFVLNVPYAASVAETSYADVMVHLSWGDFCDRCGEAVFAGPALEVRENAFVALRAEVEGVLGPREVAAIREKLKRSQRQAGQLLGGGPRAFQTYESGEQQGSVPMANLLRLLAKDPRRLRELPGAERR